MTENPKPQPDPNAGQPPGSASGQPAQPTPPGPASQTPPTGSTPGEPPKPAGSASPSEPAPGTGPTAGEATADGTGVPATENAWDSAPEDETEYSEPRDPNAPDIGVAATFLPGIEAGSLLALLLALIGAGSYLLVYPLVQAHGAARTWSDFKNNVPRARQDPFGTERDWISYQSWSMIILGLVAILIALLVLGMWTAQRNKLYSRVFAQAALTLGLAVVLYGILLKTGAVGAQIPSMKEIGRGLSSQQ